MVSEAVRAGAWRLAMRGIMQANACLEAPRKARQQLTRSPSKTLLGDIAIRLCNPEGQSQKAYSTQSGMD